MDDIIVQSRPYGIHVEVPDAWSIKALRRAIKELNAVLKDRQATLKSKSENQGKEKEHE